MPSYKTHAIHGEMILPEINNRVEINKEDLKSFCMGPDALIVTDYRLFELQHIKSTRKYFKTLIKLIKENKLQDNSEVMAFLYGQLDHFILDMIMHPLIYYMTNEMPMDVLNKMLDYEGFINKTSKYKLGQQVRITSNYNALYKQMKVGVTDYDAKRDTKECLGKIGTIIGVHQLTDMPNIVYMVEIDDLMYPLSEELLSKA